MKEYFKNIGKSILKKLIIFGIILAIIAATIAGCSIYEHIKNMPSKKDVEMYDKYSSYQRYDYHLKCFSKEDHITDRFDIKYVDDGDGSEYHGVKVRFQKISGVNDEQFVYSYWERPVILGAFNEETLLQNPDNYVDVLKDWTVSKIEFIYYDNRHYYPDKGIVIEQKTEETVKIFLSTDDDKIISDLKSCILNDKTEDELKKYNEYDGNYLQDRFSTHIRIHFKESDNIIWETEVYRYSSIEKEDSLIYIDVGRETTGFVDNRYVESQIFKYPELQNWIEESFASLDSPN